MSFVHFVGILFLVLLFASVAVVGMPDDVDEGPAKVVRDGNKERPKDKHEYWCTTPVNGRPEIKVPWKGIYRNFPYYDVMIYNEEEFKRTRYRRGICVVGGPHLYDTREEAERAIRDAKK